MRTILVPLAAACCLISHVHATCTVLTVPEQNESDGAFVVEGDAMRVSAIIDCSGIFLGSQFPDDSGSSDFTCNATSCALYSEPNYHVRLSPMLNITVDNDVKESIFNLVQDHLFPRSDAGFNESGVYGLSITAELCISEGQIGWLEYTPRYVCVEGLLSDCGENGPADQTPIRACGVQTSSSFLAPQVVGNIANVFGESGVEGSPAPPNATADATTSAPSATGSSEPEGDGAHSMLMSSGLIAAQSFVLAAIFGAAMVW